MPLRVLGRNRRLSAPAAPGLPRRSRRRRRAAAHPRARRPPLAGDHCGRVVRDDDDVVLRLEAALLDLGVHERRVGEAELLEQQARPAFVDVPAVVALVHRHAEACEVVHPVLRVGLQRQEVDAGLVRDCPQQRVGRGSRDEEVAGAEPGRCLVDAADGNALVEKEVDGLERLVLPPVDEVADRVLLHAADRLHGRDLANLTRRHHVHRIHAHAHELGHRVGGHVVRPDRRAVAVARVGVVGVVGLAEEVADQPHLGLRHRDDVAAGCVDHAVRSGERLVGHADLDALNEQLSGKLRRRQRVVLRHRDDVGGRLSLGASLGLPLRLEVGVPEHRLAVSRREVERGPRRRLLALEDVAQPPPAARPRVGEVGLRLVGGQVAHAALELVGVDEHRRRQLCAGRFGQHPGDVVERRYPVEAEVAPPGVLRVVEHAGEPGLLFLVSDVRAVPAQLAPDQRVGHRADRVRVGRHVDARAVRPHLVVVDVGLGPPVGEENLRHVLRLDQVGHERVAVVVVARVLVVEHRRRAPLELGAERLLVPVVDDDLAVWIEAGDHQEDDVVEDALGLLVLPGRQVVGQLDGHLRAADLGGVQAHRLADDRLALGDELPDVGLGEPARVADLQVDLAQAIELREIGRRGNDDEQEPVAHGARPHVDHLDPVALGLKLLVVIHHPVPAGHLPVGAHLKPEVLLRRGHRLRRLGQQAGRRKQDGSSEQDHQRARHA